MAVSLCEDEKFTDIISAAFRSQKLKLATQLQVLGLNTVDNIDKDSIYNYVPRIKCRISITIQPAPDRFPF